MIHSKIQTFAEIGRGEKKVEEKEREEAWICSSRNVKEEITLV